MRRLAAIATIFGAAARLDIEQFAELDPVRVEVRTMNTLCLEKEVVERKIIEQTRACERPCIRVGFCLLFIFRAGWNYVKHAFPFYL